MTLADLFLPAIETASAREQFSGFVSIESSAIDLYKRGLNVFPIPSPIELRELAQRVPNQFKADEKRPYILTPLFFSRMHLCDERCEQNEIKTGKKCKGKLQGLKFEDLFLGANLAVMLGRTSRNLVCIDCDSHDSFTQILDQFQKQGLPFWAYESSRGGNLLLRIKEYELRAKSQCDFPDIQVWGHDHFCVLPPSVHNTGAIYTWLPGANPFDEVWKNGGIPEVSINDIEWIGLQELRLNHEVSNQSDLPYWTRCMSRQNRTILESHLREGERNSILIKPTYEIAALINNGSISYSEGQEVLLRAAANCQPPYPKNEILQMLKSAMHKKGLTKSHEYYQVASSDDQIWNKAIRFSEFYDWASHKRTGLMDKAIFVACCERSRMDNCEIFRASVRELAENANVQTLITVSRSLKRLQSRGLIEFVGKTNAGAFQYRFGKMIFADYHSITTCNTNVLTSKPQKHLDQQTRDLEDDVFGKLGRVSRRTWEYLIDNPESTVASIARATKLNYHSIYKILPKLLGLEIVSYSRAEGVYIGEKLQNDKLFELSMKLGVYGKSDRKRTSYQIEREVNVNAQIWKERQRLQCLLDGLKKNKTMTEEKENQNE